MFIKNISKILEGLIYILLGVVVSSIIIVLFSPLLSNDVVEALEDFTEVSIFAIFVLQPIPFLLSKYVNGLNDSSLKQFLSKLIYVLRNIHIALGILFIGLRTLHVEINVLFDTIEWDIETITSILLSIVLIPTIIYAILRIKESEKYRKPHRFFLILTYLIFLFHLFH